MKPPRTNPEARLPRLQQWCHLQPLKKSQVFVTPATILSTLQWWLSGKLNLLNIISFRSPSSNQIWCNWLNAVHDFKKISERILTTPERNQNKTGVPEILRNSQMFCSSSDYLSLPFFFYLGLRFCVSYIEKHHLCYEPLSSWVSPCSCPADRKRSCFLWNGESKLGYDQGFKL